MTRPAKSDTAPLAHSGTIVPECSGSTSGDATRTNPNSIPSMVREASKRRLGTAFMKRRIVLPITLLAIHACLLFWGALLHSPTLCESAHLAAGVSHWRYGNFGLYRVNPPLVRLVAAAPTLLLADTKCPELPNFAPGARPEFGYGDRFVSANADRYFWLFTVARWACIPFSILGGLICWRWADELYGHSAGITALVLWCFNPDIIANGQMLTPDGGAAALGVTASYFFWGWLKTPDWSHALAAGVTLGLCELTKSSWIILFAVWPCLWLAWLLTDSNTRHSRTAWIRHALQMASVLGIGLYTINLGYGFEGTGKALGEYIFVSDSLKGSQTTGEPHNRFAESWLGRISVPLPENYVLGIDDQKRDFEHPRWPSYLRGQMQERGWWYFYLYGFLVKTPLGVWMLLFMALFLPAVATHKNRWRDSMILIEPMITMVILVSSQTGFSIHLRYLLPILPFCLIWISRAIPAAHQTGVRSTALAIGALTLSVVSSLAVYPHSLSYFNEVAGGPGQGDFHLINSPIDWGQDLYYLKRWNDQHPEARTISLAYFGYLDPRLSGLDGPRPPFLSEIESSTADVSSLKPGWYAVSVTLLHGFPRPHFNPKSTSPRNAYTYFLSLSPVSKAGYSINIYCLTDHDVQQIHDRFVKR